MTLTPSGSIALRCVMALCCAWLAGCESCRGTRHDVPLATMLELRGDSAQRDYAQHREQWERADLRAKFWLGDGLRTDPPSSALLSLANGAQLHVRSGTLIRFLIDGQRDGEQGIDVQTGEAVLSSGASDMRLRTHVGLAVLAAGSRIVLTREGDDLRLNLEVGEAQFRNERDEAVKLAIGEGVLLKVGMAVLAKPAEGATPAHVETAPKAGTIVAKLDQDGILARDPGQHNWHALERGERALTPGTGLRLPAGTKMTLTRGDDVAELRGAGEYSIGEGATWVDAERGDLRVRARSGDIEVVVPGGRIIVHAANGGGSAGVRIGEGEGALDVQQGSVTFKDKVSSREVVAASPYHWTFASAAAPTDSAAPPDAIAGPDYSNFGIAAGESFVVHAPEVPVALSIEFGGKCPVEGLVEVVQGHRRSRGAGQANALLPVGTRTYTLRCIDAHGVTGAVIAHGTAVVLRDSGTRKLPPIAPTTEIDADGRSYTIFYQNQLPNVRLHWPNAPSTNNYQLLVDGTPMSVPSPEHVFQSGSLRDGVHHLNFEAQGRKSRTATVTVRFDNTAPTASLGSPADRGWQPGDRVDIEGVALPAWKVSVQGGTIEKVGDDRFRGQVVTSQEHPDIAVRLVHPRLGTHYYLRRATGSR
jgi:hypothetical protein